MPKQGKYTSCLHEVTIQAGADQRANSQVVGRRQALDIDIYHTPDKGWAVRNPTSYDADYENGIFNDYTGKVIKQGTALAIYSGEVITRAEGAKRGE